MDKVITLTTEERQIIEFALGVLLGRLDPGVTPQMLGLANSILGKLREEGYGEN